MGESSCLLTLCFVSGWLWKLRYDDWSLAYRCSKYWIFGCMQEWRKVPSIQHPASSIIIKFSHQPHNLDSSIIRTNIAIHHQHAFHTTTNDYRTDTMSMASLILARSRVGLALPSVRTLQIRAFTSPAVVRPTILQSNSTVLSTQIRGMKVRSSVKKMCEGCKVSQF